MSSSRPDRRLPHPCAFVARRPSIALRALCCARDHVVSSLLPPCLCRHAPDEHDSMAGVACRRAEIALLETLRQRQRRASTPDRERGRHESVRSSDSHRCAHQVGSVAAMQRTAVHGRAWSAAVSPRRTADSRTARRPSSASACAPRCFCRALVPPPFPPVPRMRPHHFCCWLCCRCGRSGGTARRQRGQRKEKARRLEKWDQSHSHCIHITALSDEHPLFAPS